MLIKTTVCGGHTGVLGNGGLPHRLAPALPVVFPRALLISSTMPGYFRLVAQCWSAGAFCGQVQSVVLDGLALATRAHVSM